MKRNLIIYLVLLLACFSPMQAQKAISTQEQVIENKIRLNELEKKVTAQEQEMQSASDKKQLDLETKLELKKENLDYKSNWVNYLLAILGILITFFGIGIPIVAVYYGRKFYSEIEEEKEKAKAELEVFKNDFKDSLGQLIKNSRERVQLLEEKAQVSITNLCKYEQDGKDISNGLNDLLNRATDPNSSDKDKKDSKLEAKKLGNEALSGTYGKEMAETLELYFAENYKEALPKLLNILKVFPNDINLIDLSSIYFYIAVSYQTSLEQDNSINAIEYYKKSTEINPAFFNAWYNLGCLYIRIEKSEDAIECFKKAIEIKPNLHKAWNNLGTLFGRKNDFEKALEYYKKALEYNNKYLEAYQNIIELTIANNNFEDAEYYLNKSKDELDGDDFILKLLEIFYSILKNNWDLELEETFEQLKKVIDNNPSKINWSFDFINKWLASRRSEFINQEQRTFISELISLIEAWKLEDQKP